MPDPGRPARGPPGSPGTPGPGGREGILKAARWILGAYALLALWSWTGVGLDPPERQWVGLEGLPPGLEHPLGTDALGRDVLSRLVHGTRIAFLLGLPAALLSVALGGLLGLASAWYRGPVEGACEWLAGVVAAVPGLVLLLALGHVLGPGLGSLVLALSLSSWVTPYRLARAEVLQEREAGWVLAARATGTPGPGILRRHLLPALLPLLAVQAGLLFAASIQAEALLGFLGLGLEAGQPSWGRILEESRLDLEQGLWIPFAGASLAILGLVASVQRLAEAGIRKGERPGSP